MAHGSTKLANNNGKTKLARSNDNVGLLLERGSIVSKLPAKSSIRHLGMKPNKENVIRHEVGEAVFITGFFLDSSGLKDEGKAWDTRTNNGLETIQT